ncbi:hypothetical protein FNB79_11925 [Formosa sediminum]|uniref:Uncharacterized protein n=1 Tax=Formosa sediminum TaxID=2594004 RepID=A0A516GSY9_9FLAO|nr:hypothetical protein [Formosa sediminum]QDO94636.1 hypothetical protein FNB79_11925 [Formosa sediminum]
MNEYILNESTQLASENIENSFIYNIIKDFVFPFILALIGALAAWFVLIKQLVNDKKKEKKTNKEDLENRLAYFSILIDNAIENSKGQNENIKTLISDIEHSGVNFVPLMKYPTYDLKIMAEKIDKENYLLSYLKFYSQKDKIKTLNEFKKILDSCGIINDVFTQINKDLESKQIFESNQKENYFKKLNHWADLFGTSLVHLKENNNPLFYKLFEINTKSEQIKNLNSNKIFEAQFQNLLIPTLEILDKAHSEHIEFDENTGNLWTTTSSVINIYKNLERASHGIKNMLIQQNKFITIQINSLEKASEKLRKEFLH